MDLIAKIKENLATELQNREEARARLARLQDEAANIPDRITELESQRRELQQQQANMISTGDTHGTSQAGTEIETLTAKISRERSLGDAVTGGVKAAEAQVQEAQQGLQQAVKLALLQRKAAIELEISEQLGAIMATVNQWNNGIDELVRDVGVFNADQGIFGGSSDLCLMFYHPTFFKYFTNTYGVGIDADWIKNQLQHQARIVEQLKEQAAA